MCRMLIVDDEVITREGITENLNLEELGVSAVAYADDGVNGLFKAREWRPDIVLADVRMPRMNGIDMAIGIQELFPDCAIIFMSGYSDKHYLKAAIQLKAVSYVEKPIIIQELEEAVRSAVDLCREVKARRRNEANRLTALRKALCLSMTRPKEPVQLREQAQAADVPLDDASHLVTVLLKVSDRAGDPKPEEWEERLSQHVQCCSEANGFHYLLAQKDDLYTVIHLYQDRSYAYRLQPATLRRFCDCLSVSLSGQTRFALAVGRPVEGIASAYDSYQSAVVVLQQAFYRGYDCVLLDEGLAENGKPYPLDQPILKEWTSLLEARDWIEAERFLNALSQALAQRQSNLVTSVKQFYALMALALNNLAKSRGVDPSHAGQDGNLLFWELLSSMETLQEVNEFLQHQLMDARLALEDTRSPGNFVEEVVRYIKQHYADEDLSVAMLAERVHLAPAYLSFLFKEKKEENLNTFITRTRIEKASELLQNRSLSVAEIAGMVGIRDGNYFTKLFRKITGDTPKEYRMRFRS
ncbi:response regulator [Cohnella suwonensis]|uniref:Response regulator n=1 Tax=Cohnella suwonensis TaxID=696072 RepID=A0ABW0LTW7_9BACL